MMTYKICLFVFLSIVISMASACGGTESGNTTANANSNSTTNSAHPPMNTVRNEGPSLNDAPTLAPVVQQYWKALETKNDAMLRETLTSDFQKSLEEDMKAENRKGDRGRGDRGSRGPRDPPSGPRPRNPHTAPRGARFG